MTPAPLLVKRANGRLLLMGPAYLQRPTDSSMRGSERAVQEAGRAACQTALTCQSEHTGGGGGKARQFNLLSVHSGYGVLASVRESLHLLWTQAS